MDLKKSLFGGYNKVSVDAAIKQMQENEEQAQAKISLLENEYRLSKENSQKNMESIQTESMIRQKSLIELTKTLEEKNARLAELEEKQVTMSKDIEEQFRVLVSNLEEKQSTKTALLEKSHAAAMSSLEESNKTKIAFLENKYNIKVAELEERYQRDVGAIRQNDEQVKRIGQLYVDAQEYTEKMKLESKAKIIESVDQVFEEIFKAQEQYETSVKEISQKNQNMKQMAGDLLENIHALQSKVENMEREQGNIMSPFDNIRSVKERIKHQIHNQYEKEIGKRSGEPVQKNEEPSEKQIHEEKEIVSAPVQKTEQDASVIDYAMQLAELKQRLERQEELLSMQNIKVTAAMESISSHEPMRTNEPAATVEPDYIAETAFPGFPAEESQPDYIETSPVVTDSENAAPFFVEEDTVPPQIPGYETELVSDTQEEPDIRNEKEQFDHESYSKYFAEIGKKFSKEQPLSAYATTLEESPSGIPASEEPEKSEEKKETADETENVLPKKPSIKDILNKYANLK